MDMLTQLHLAHGCPDGCDDCAAIREAEDEQRPELLSRWRHYVESQAALRHARNTVEFGMPFPSVSKDPLIQYVVHESVMERWHTEQAEVAERAEQEQEAHRLAKEDLDAIAPPRP